jgi:hypothetical protein
MVGAAVAQGPSGTYASGIACANLGTSAATISLVFYNANGTTALSYTDPATIAVGGSRNYFTPSSPAGLPSGFVGSAVVSSDQPLACTVNTQAVGTGLGTAANPARVDTSAGVTSDKVNSILYAPQVIKALGGFNSYVSVQNTESAAQTVYVSYVDRFGTAYPAARESFSIPAQSSHIFYQSQNANLPSGFLGGATITSTGKLAAVIAFYNDAANTGRTQFNTYSAFPSGANKVLLPRVVRNYYGFQGGLSVQNVGTSATAITITFAFAGNSYSVNNVSINPGATYSPYLPGLAELAPVDALAVGQRFGNAVIQAAPGGSIVAIVNEDNRGTCNSAPGCGTIPTEQVGFSNTYTGFTDGAQTTTVFFTQVTRKAGSIYSGGFQLANTTGTATTCNITYSGAAGANESNVALAANGSLSRFAPNVANLPDGFNSSVKVVCGQPVVGISNLSARTTGYFGDSFAAANGLNQ